MGAAVAVILVRERRVVEAFESAGATSPAQARPADALRVDEHGVAMRRLMRRAVVREAAPGMYFLDVPSWRALRGMRRRVAFALVAVVAVLIAFGVLGPTPWTR